jgi:hypothetical protein
MRAAAAQTEWMRGRVEKNVRMDATRAGTTPRESTESTNASE